MKHLTHLTHMNNVDDIIKHDVDLTHMNYIEKPLELNKNVQKLIKQLVDMQQMPNMGKKLFNLLKDVEFEVNSGEDIAKIHNVKSFIVNVYDADNYLIKNDDYSVESYAFCFSYTNKATNETYFDEYDEDMHISDLIFKLSVKHWKLRITLKDKLDLL